MDITIIGAGNMGRGISTRMLEGGNNVTLIDSEAEDARALAAELQEVAPSGSTVSTGEGTLSGDIVILAVPYQALTSVLDEYGDQFEGKIVVDITNPVDFETMDPLVKPGTSAAEEVAAAAPESARVLKAFNTTFAGTLVEGEVLGQPLDVLIAGDDAEAKSTLAKLVKAGGMRPIDAGPLRWARQLEALGLLHMALQSTLGSEFGSAVKFVE